MLYSPPRSFALLEDDTAVRIVDVEDAGPYGAGLRPAEKSGV